MQDRPKIATAIPRGRYRVGDHSATLLGEIDSQDGRNYRYILAFVAPGRNEPSLYFCSEAGNASAPRQCLLRVVGEGLSEELDRDERWADAETFATQGLELGRRMLGLREAEIQRLS